MAFSDEEVYSSTSLGSDSLVSTASGGGASLCVSWNSPFQPIQIFKTNQTIWLTSFNKQHCDIFTHSTVQSDGVFNVSDCRSE